MKKNLITVIILALVLANLILTAILVFTIIPQTTKSIRYALLLIWNFRVEKIRRPHRKCQSKTLKLIRLPMDLP